jgi:hypothetical protein
MAFLLFRFLFVFDLIFEIGQRVDAGIFKLADPAVDNVSEWDRIEIVKLASSLPVNRDQIGFFQYSEMLRDPLTGHGEALAQIIQALSAFLKKAVEKQAARLIGKGLEDICHARYYATKWLHVKITAERAAVCSHWRERKMR